MKRSTGFTLVEVLVVVAIVGILSAIAVPQYRDYVTRGKISEATSSLSELRLRAEKFFSDNRSYSTFNATIPNARFFTYACTTSTTAFTCTATGVTAQGMGGFAYTVNESNTRTSTFTSLTGWNNSTTCWVTKKGETC
jgi:type IV pilus assembly protein PilE